MLGSIMEEPDSGETFFNKPLTESKGISKMIRDDKRYFDALKGLADFHDGVFFPVEIQFREGAKGWKQQDTLCSRELQLFAELCLIIRSLPTLKLLDLVT